MSSSVTSTQTNRLVSSLVYERRELQEETEQAIGALDATIAAQDNCIRAMTDEMALLKAKVAQLNNAAEELRRSNHVQNTFMQEQQALITDLRTDNSRLTASDRKLRNLFILHQALEAKRESEESRRYLESIEDIHPGMRELYKQQIHRSLNGEFYDLIVKELLSSTTTVIEEIAP